MDKTEVECLLRQYDSVVERINDLARVNKKPVPRLIAVSKKQSVKKIEVLYKERGHVDFGENYLQELQEKAPLLEKYPDISWHFLGRLQSRKIPKIIKICRFIHCVESVEHLRVLAKEAQVLGDSPRYFFWALNFEGQQGKSGLPGVGLLDAYATANALLNKSANLLCLGIFTLPSIEYQDREGLLQTPPESYLYARRLAVAVGMGRLSLGMSGDLGLAIAAGTDFVRIGTAIFGARKL